MLRVAGQFDFNIKMARFRDLVPATTFITYNVKYAQEFQACNGIPLSEIEQTQRYAKR